MRRVERTEIAGHTLVCTQLGIRDARAGLLILARVLGAEVIANAGEASGDTRSQIVRMIGGALNALKPEDLSFFEKAFSAGTAVQVDVTMSDDRKLKLPVQHFNFEQFFEGNLGGWLEWMMFHLQLNYADFLGVKMKSDGEAGEPARISGP